MSIVEIARIADVSKSTVSRVINGRPGPSERTVQLVKKVMSEIGYKPVPPPFRAGRPLASHSGIKTGNIAMLLLGVESTILKGTYAEVVQGVESALGKHNFSLVLKSVTNPKHLPPIVTQGKIDGLIILGKLELSEPVLAQLRKIPTVWVMHKYGGWGDHFLLDSEAIGHKSAEHFLLSGCRSLAVIYAGNPDKNEPFYVRIKGFCQAAHDSGIETHILSTKDYCGYNLNTNIMTPDFIIAMKKHFELLCEQLEKLSPRPIGVFVPNGTEAAILYGACNRRGIKLGKDVCVATCDLLSCTTILSPPPVSFDLQCELLGRRAADQLLWRLANPNEGGKIRTMFEPKLIDPIRNKNNV